MKAPNSASKCLKLLFSGYINTQKIPKITEKNNLRKWDEVIKLTHCQPQNYLQIKLCFKIK